MDKEDILEFIKLVNRDNVTKVDLSNKDINVLPPEIGQLTNVEHLDLSYNNIEYLPTEIGKLKNLKTLLLLRNRLTKLPGEIGKLRNLTLIDVSHNKFTKIPIEIGNLTELKTLDASYGKLQELPFDFIKLLSLRELYLEENNFVFPPSKVVKRGLYATMYFLTAEKKKRDASKVILQVFNIPQQIKKPFVEYIECFNDIVSASNKNNVLFEVKFMRHDIQPEIQLQAGVKEHLKEFLDYVKQNVSQLNGISHEKLASNLFNMEIVELKNQIQSFNETLNHKLEEIQGVQEKMEHFTKLLDKASKK